MIQMVLREVDYTNTILFYRMSFDNHHPIFPASFNEAVEKLAHKLQSTKK